jgi:hypothetical protein
MGYSNSRADTVTRSEQYPLYSTTSLHYLGPDVQQHVATVRVPLPLLQYPYLNTL